MFNFLWELLDIVVLEKFLIWGRKLWNYVRILIMLLNKGNYMVIVFIYFGNVLVYFLIMLVFYCC